MSSTVADTDSPAGQVPTFEAVHVDPNTGEVLDVAPFSGRVHRSVDVSRVKRPYRVDAPFAPAGDQPATIAGVVAAIKSGERFACVRGITGSGKSATMAWVIEQLGRPALVLAPNKTLAAQLYGEFKELLPDSRVEYFVSYYDYYRPEAYMPASDTFIEKESQVNDEIDRRRHASTAAALSRSDCVIVASVSCVYGLGVPDVYARHLVVLRKGDQLDTGGEGAARHLARKLIAVGYDRNDIARSRGTFRLRGDTLEVYVSGDDAAIRIECYDDEIEKISRVHDVTGETIEVLDEAVIWPASQWVVDVDALPAAIGRIEDELSERLVDLTANGKLLEAQRLGQRTNYDLEMLRETGWCPGVENYSGPLEGRTSGEPPATLLDYFGDDLIVFIDESHVAVPQLRSTYAGDRSRKDNLVEHGFRLPSARDNRPLMFDETLERLGQTVFVSATPGPFELELCPEPFDLVVRPTGLLDPTVEVLPSIGQIDDLLDRIRERTACDERTLVTTLTKKQAEQLCDFLDEHGVKSRFLHSDVLTLERVELLRELRLGSFDVLVGVNLLREGLDLPEVSLIAILDADKEGFLRSATALIQTMGRAARNVNGHVVLYANRITPAMRSAMDESERRRTRQIAYNSTHGIVPRTISKGVRDVLTGIAPPPTGKPAVCKVTEVALTADELIEAIRQAEVGMHTAAAELAFEEAARLRDVVARLRTQL